MCVTIEPGCTTGTEQTGGCSDPHLCCRPAQAVQGHDNILGQMKLSVSGGGLTTLPISLLPGGPGDLFYRFPK